MSQGENHATVPVCGTAAEMLAAIWAALGGGAEALSRVEEAGAGDLPSVYPVSDLAVAAIGAAGLAVAESRAGGAIPQVRVDRRRAGFWFHTAVRPEGWSLPPIWDAVAGDYAAADGWVRLHTNAPHHRAAALAVLAVPEQREVVAGAVARWEAAALEEAVVAAGGCAAMMRTAEQWRGHPQGCAVAAEPLVHMEMAGNTGAASSPPGAPERPLAGVRVLDLTRVLAGPVATRFLAGFGAEVLRIDPPWWDEPAVVPDMTVGKRCARLDLRAVADRAVLERLLAGADVLVHGYRSDALERLGLSATRRREINPGLVDVGLDAYGWTGPWRSRRGFDSLVQMSTGIAEAGMRRLGRDRPTPLPVQALDHAAGYVLAAAAVRGITRRRATGEGCRARTSLARIAHLLTAGGDNPIIAPAPEPETPADVAPAVEHTAWGPARRLVPPLEIDGTPLAWDRPASALGSAPAAWLA